MGPVGTPMGTRLCPFVSHFGPARIQSGRRGCTMLSRGEVAERSVEGRRNVTRCSFAVFATCATIPSASL